jgi:hypothetical protein
MVDTDGSGEIDFDEFVAMMKSVEKQPSQKKNFSGSIKMMNHLAPLSNANCIKKVATLEAVKAKKERLKQWSAIVPGQTERKQSMKQKRNADKAVVQATIPTKLLGTHSKLLWRSNTTVDMNIFKAESKAGQVCIVQGYSSDDPTTSYELLYLDYGAIVNFVAGSLRTSPEADDPLSAHLDKLCNNLDPTPRVIKYITSRISLTPEGALKLSSLAQDIPGGVELPQEHVLRASHLIYNVPPLSGRRSMSQEEWDTNISHTNNDIDSARKSAQISEQSLNTIQCSLSSLDSLLAKVRVGSSNSKQTSKWKKAGNKVMNNLALDKTKIHLASIEERKGIISQSMPAIVSPRRRTK